MGSPWVARLAARIAGARSRVVVGSVIAVAALPAITLVVIGPPPLAHSMVAVRPRALAPLRTQDELFERFGGQSGQWLALVGPGPREVVLEAGDRATERLSALVALRRLEGVDSLTTWMPTEATQRARLEGRPRVALDRAAVALGESLERRGFARGPFEPAMEALRAPSMRVTPVEARSAGARLLVDRHLGRLGRDDDGWLLALLVHPIAGADAGHLAAVLRSTLRDVRAGRHAVRLTGYPLLDAEVGAALRRSFPWVAGTAALLVLAVVLLALRGGTRERSAIGGAAAAFVAFAAITVELTCVLVALRAFGVALDAYALLALPVVVGITIDETLFVLHAVRAASGPEHGDVRARVVDAVRETGRPTLGTTATAVAAFAPLVVCEFDGLRSIGWVGATGAAVGLVVALVVVPALVRVSVSWTTETRRDPRDATSR